MLTKRGLRRAWIAPVLALLLLAGAFLLPRQQETEYAVIQAIIEHIEDYRSEIEGWGYRVSVLSDGAEAPADTCLALQSRLMALVHERRSAGVAPHALP